MYCYIGHGLIAILLASHDCEAGNYSVDHARHRRLELGVVHTQCARGECRNESANLISELMKADIARFRVPESLRHLPDGMNGDRGHRGAGHQSKPISSYAVYLLGSAAWSVVRQKG